MSKLSRSEQIIAEKTVCVLLVRGQNQEGKPMYAYVAIRADKLEEFMAAQKKGLFFPEDFGIVVASGEGEPDAETRERMTRDYGFNHDKMIDIQTPDKAHDVASRINDYTGLTVRSGGESGSEEDKNS